jgi:hypothetical protein
MREKGIIGKKIFLSFEIWIVRVGDNVYTDQIFSGNSYYSYRELDVQEIGVYLTRNYLQN